MSRARPYADAAFNSKLPGIGLKEYIQLSGMTYSAFARLVPCAVSYPRLLAEGIARPSYEMAVRIEQITSGCVPRVRWYPAGDDRLISEPTGDNTDDLFDI